MTSDRKKSGVAFWATVVLVVAVLYPASTGPLVWLDAHQLFPAWARGPVDALYTPLEFAGDNSRFVRGAFKAYWRLWGYRWPEIKNALPG